jgi:hypothetical protein
MGQKGPSYNCTGAVWSSVVRFQTHQLLRYVWSRGCDHELWLKGHHMGKKKPNSKCRSSSCRNEIKVFRKSGEYSFYSIYISFTLFPFFILLLQLLFVCCFLL